MVRYHVQLCYKHPKWILKWALEAYIAPWARHGHEDG